jgi:hypothetical protein
MKVKRLFSFGLFLVVVSYFGYQWLGTDINSWWNSESGFFGIQGQQTAGQSIEGLLCIAAIIAVYLAPTIVAATWGRGAGVINTFFVNMLFGWTFIGWIVAFGVAGWAKSNRDNRPLRAAMRVEADRIADEESRLRKAQLAWLSSQTTK